MLYPRFIKPLVEAALAESPVVLIIGARQTGKTTLVQNIVQAIPVAHYLSLDELTIRAAARSDPHGFVKGLSGTVVIDEIQLASELLSAIKLEVDRDRKPGRFLLTGSASVLTLPRVFESLAGRIEILTLYPLSQGEIGSKREAFIDEIFKERLALSPTKEDGPSVWHRVADGGYPEIQKRTDPVRKGVWFKDYATTVLQRDVRDLASVNGITQMPRLLQLLATRTSTLLNAADLSRILQIPQTSMKRYLALFEATFLIHRLPAWSSNLGKRVIKTPKLYFTDTGLAAHLLGVDAGSLPQQLNLKGPLLENFVVSELQKQIAWSRTFVQLFHFRSQSGQEVDLVLEDQRGRCIGIEIKSAASVRSEDFDNLRWFARELGNRFLRGIILHTGDVSVAFAENMCALPVHTVWRTVFEE